MIQIPETSTQEMTYAEFVTWQVFEKLKELGLDDENYRWYYNHSKHEWIVRIETILIATRKKLKQVKRYEEAEALKDWTYTLLHTHIAMLRDPLYRYQANSTN